MFKFIHAADVHLDSPLRGLQTYEGAPTEEIRGAARRALENLVDFALQQQVQFVVIAGDLYDGDWNDYNSGLFLVRQIARLREAGVATFIISGNHDAANKITHSLPLPDNPSGAPVVLSAHTPETVRLEDLGVAIHGRGFEEAAVSENVVPSYPAAAPGWFNLGMLHTSLDYESGGDHARYAPCKMADLAAKEYQYWALGHIHQRIERHAPGDPPVMYPGNLQGRHIRECGPKGCLLVTVDDQHNAVAEFTPLDVFRWERLSVDVSTAHDADEAIALCREALAELVQGADRPLGVRVELNGDTPAHETLAGDLPRYANQIRAAAITVAGERMWIEKIKLRTQHPQRQTSDLSIHEGPLAELLSYIKEVQGDDEQLRSLGQTLAELDRRLPSEVTQGPEGLSLLEPGTLRELLGDVEPLLVDRLTGKDSS